MESQKRMRAIARFFARYSPVKYIMVDTYAFEIMRIGKFEQVNGANFWDMVKVVVGMNRAKVSGYSLGIR
jgi:hypothetical protein